MGIWDKYRANRRWLGQFLLTDLESTPPPEAAIFVAACARLINEWAASTSINESLVFTSVAYDTGGVVDEPNDQFLVPADGLYLLTLSYRLAFDNSPGLGFFEFQIENDGNSPNLIERLPTIGFTSDVTNTLDSSPAHIITLSEGDGVRGAITGLWASDVSNVRLSSTLLSIARLGDKP